jgi:hypothetical protein
VVAVLGTVVVPLAACGSSGSASSLSAEAQQAVTEGAEFLQANIDQIDSLHLSGLDHIYRRWGVEPLAGFGAAASAAGSQVPPSGGGVPTEEQALARLVDPARRVPPAGTASLPDTSRVMVSGLYCDVRPLTDDDLAAWQRELGAGGYGPTHVLLAWFFMEDLGCEDPRAASLAEEAVQLVAAELGSRASTSPLELAVDDLSVEQIVVLAEAGRADLVGSGWVDAIVAAQRDDGRWQWRGPLAEPDTFDWHATALAVWALNALGGEGKPEAWVRR